MNNNNQTECKKPFGARLFILLTVCMMVVVMAAPAFAANPDDFLPEGYPPLASDMYGDYQYLFSTTSTTNYPNIPGVTIFDASELEARHLQGTTTDILLSGTGSYVKYGYYAGSWHVIAGPSSVADGRLYLNDIIACTFDIYTFTGDAIWRPADVVPPDLGEEVTNVLPTVLSWIQQTLNALFVEGGALQGLLLLVAVPVAITLLFLAARFIRNLIWGA